MTMILFRLLELASGNITIDGIDIKSVGKYTRFLGFNGLDLKKLRNRLTIIPQEPVLFFKTLRENMDPENHFSDNEIWDVLRIVDLAKNFTHLDVDIAAGASLSSGEKQLLCIARALLKQSKVVILDEVPSTQHVTYSA